MKILKTHSVTLLLLLSILGGAFAGLILGSKASYLKPLGDLFLNFIFVCVIPLVFFSVASAIAAIQEPERLLRLTCTMFSVFIVMSLIAAIFMLICVKLFLTAPTLALPLHTTFSTSHISWTDQLINTISTPNFLTLFSRDNMLALIVFSALVGLATHRSKEKGVFIAKFLYSGKEVSIKLLSLIMYFAPIGFFSFFANLIGTLGSKILHTYLQATLLYYLAALGFFFIGFSLYSLLAGNVKIFWKNIFLPASTAFATCSSAASIPANLIAAENMGVSKTIADLTIPLGGVIHKDGSVLGGMLKIAFLFGLFHLPFAGVSVFATAILVSVLVGTVMGAIPSGGMIGEMLIISCYGFPPNALMIIAVISILIDPPATLLNVTCNTAAASLIARFT